MEPKITRPLGTAKAIGRSLRIYHGPDAPKVAMDALYARFVKPGDLVFDIGAHVGDRVSSFRRLGARVVALEPQEGPMRALQLIHGRDSQVILLAFACGPKQGDVAFRINSANLTVSTASAAFVEAANGAEGWEGQIWDTQRIVPMTTLDALISTYGMPAFVKIDVEGFEADVLAGLSQRLPMFSFEFTTIQKDVAVKCLHFIASIGTYRFNLACGESQDLRFNSNVGLSELMIFIDEIPHDFNSGDIYCYRSTIF